MKILIIIPSIENISGVDYHRLLIPHKMMERTYKDIEYFTADDLTIVPKDVLKSIDLVICNRMLSKKGMNAESLEIMKTIDAKLIVDQDDDYQLPNWHIMYEDAKHANHSKSIIDTMAMADHVTCTHSNLANTLKTIYKGEITLIPNCILPEDQFELTKELEKDRLIFGWSGSITHFDDVMEMYESLVPLYNDPILGEKFQMVYGGFYKGDMPSEAIAGVLSAKRTAKPEQFTYIPATTPREYANFYNEINVCLIPLRANRFNENKSNLKMLEAGFKNRACIVSPVNPYLDLINAGKNCLTAKNKHDWFKQMKRLIENQSLRLDLAAQLYEDVQPYHAKHIAEKRYQLYKSLIN
jgi:glycosyltransferase involved in cell wall biosynthesis